MNKKPFYQPIRPFKITQKFGENSACYSTDGKNTVIHCDGLNPPDGYRSLYGSKGHTGLDLRAYSGQPLYSAGEGVISFIDTHPRSGLDVRIETFFDGVKYRHIYEHLKGYVGSVGDKVMIGDLIGWADNTGWSSGDHLHLQVEKWVNGRWIKIDPLSVMNERYALSTAKALQQIKEQIALIAEWLVNYLRRK